MNPLKNEAHLSSVLTLKKTQCIHIITMTWLITVLNNLHGFTNSDLPSSDRQAWNLFEVLKRIWLCIYSTLANPSLDLQSLFCRLIETKIAVHVTKLRFKATTKSENVERIFAEIRPIYRKLTFYTPYQFNIEFILNFEITTQRVLKYIYPAGKAVGAWR